MKITRDLNGEAYLCDYDDVIKVSSIDSFWLEYGPRGKCTAFKMKSGEMLYLAVRFDDVAKLLFPNDRD